MSFTSGAFLFLFLPVVLGLFHALPAPARRWWLLAASAVFYAWWRLDFLALLGGIAAVAWLAGLLVARLGGRRGSARAVLACGIVLCLGSLAWFKYADFVLAGIGTLLGASGLPARPGAPPIPLLRLALPVGISFSTFKAVSYMVDVYRGALPAAAGPGKVALYIALFPQVISGPIDRFAALAPQMGMEGRSWDLFCRGALRFMLGACKKVLVADAIAPLADAAFALARPGLADAWLGSAAYTLQLYYDFSGYTDMAVGLGMMMGMRFGENFCAPYLSAGITEFWKRWHISLSSWLRDYLYIPLGGNRRGSGRTLLNLFLVMLIGGLWHGAALTFVAWGAWHGLLLAVERVRGERALVRRLPRPLGIAVTMVLVNAGWVLFRAPGFPAAAGMFAGMLGLHGAGPSEALRLEAGTLSLAALAAGALLVYLGPWAAARAGTAAGRTSRAWKIAAAGAQALLLPLFLVAVLRIAGGAPAVFLYGKF
jgi:alginate O-acetyltransferase complex protein AlgI